MKTYKVILPVKAYVEIELDSPDHLSEEDILDMTIGIYNFECDSVVDVCEIDFEAIDKGFYEIEEEYSE